MNIDEFCLLLPKVELHSHITGSVPDRILRKLVKEKYPNEDPEILVKTCKYGTQESRNLKSGFRMFEVLHEISNSLESVGEIVEGILDDYFNENCVLLELRTGPRILKDGTKEDYIRKILDTIKSFCEKKRFFCGLLLSINRSKSLENAHETFDLFEKLLPEFPDHLLGFDYSGNYRDKDFLHFREVFDKMKKKKYKVTCHFAEIKNDLDSNAILDYLPDRLGHGLFMTDDMINTMLRNSIPMEICLSSNTLSGKVRTVREHPVYHFYMRYGYPFSMNTDDRGIFSVTLSEEYVKIGRAFMMEVRDLYKVSLRAIRHSFMSEDVKKKVTEIFTDFEEKILTGITHIIIPPEPEDIMEAIIQSSGNVLGVGSTSTPQQLPKSPKKDEEEEEEGEEGVGKEEEKKKDLFDLKEDDDDDEEEEGKEVGKSGSMEEYRRLQREKWENMKKKMNHGEETEIIKKKKSPPPFDKPLSSFIDDQSETNSTQQQKPAETPTPVRIKRDEDFARKLSEQYQNEDEKLRNEQQRIQQQNNNVPIEERLPPSVGTPTPVRIRRDEIFARELMEQFEREERDRQMAMRMQQQHGRPGPPLVVPGPRGLPNFDLYEQQQTSTTQPRRRGNDQNDSDLELARRLQNQQNEQYEKDRLMAERMQNEMSNTNNNPTGLRDEDIGDGYEELMQLGERLGSVNTKATDKLTINSHSMEFIIRDTSKDVPKDCEMCMVCYEDWEVGERARRLNCLHCFHTHCVDRWLENYNAICPICREPISSVLPGTSGM